MWNNESPVSPNPRVEIISPSCLRVDRATIFLKSISVRLIIPARVIVSRPKRDMYSLMAFSPNLIIRKIPAVTRVLEWTRALMGVGALIARGSQTFKGTWALFAMQATNKNKIIRIEVSPALEMWPKKQSPRIPTRSKKSPSRLERNVVIPLSVLIHVWYQIIRSKEESPRPSQPIIRGKIEFLKMKIIIDVPKIRVIRRNFESILSSCI